MSRYAMCPDCGHRMRRVYDSWGTWDGSTYQCDYCSNDGSNEESLSVYDAAEIWASHGKDEDYTFGFSEDELEDAL